MGVLQRRRNKEGRAASDDGSAAWWREGDRSVLIQGHIHDSTWLNRGQQSLNDRHKLGDKGDLISGQHKYRKFVTNKILLKLEILVGS